MGCGTSKFDPEERGPTCKFEPFLKRPVEKISRRQRSEQLILVSNLSFKHLLIGRDCDKEKSPDNHGCKSISSPTETDDNNYGRKSVSSPIEVGGGNENHPDDYVRNSVSSPIEAGEFVEQGAFRQEDNVKVVQSENKEMERVFVFEDERDHTHAMREAEMENHDEVMDEEDGRTDEEEGGYHEREDSLIAAPGSPSFRDYCLINGHTSKDDDDGDGGKVQNTSRKEKNIVHMASMQGSATQVGKIGRNRKGRKFGNVLSKGNPKSVKNLWNVSTCYNPNYPGKLPGKTA